MPTIDEKRVYTDSSETETVFVATGVGVVAVTVSDDLVGGFGVAHRCAARDVAVGTVAADRRTPLVAVDGHSPSARRAPLELVAVAAAEDVFVAPVDDADPENPGALSFAETGFGPATAVGFDGGEPYSSSRRAQPVDGDSLLAGDADGRVARFEAGGGGGDEGGGASATDGEWVTVGETPEVRALDGDLVAAADGVHRVRDDGLASVGLDDARDVATGGDGVAPLAATGSGLYKLGNGWMEVLDGAVDAVVASADGRAHAVSGGDLFGRGDEGAWTTIPVPVEEDVAAVGHGVGATYAVTEAGTFLVRADGGRDEGDADWRHQVLGLREVGGVAVV
jgi:hypothetical protein